jgi:hypothetical protein
MFYVVNSVVNYSAVKYYFAYPTSRTMALGSTQPLAEMSTRNFPACEGRPARKADNLTAICGPIF